MYGSYYELNSLAPAEELIRPRDQEWMRFGIILVVYSDRLNMVYMQ